MRRNIRTCGFLFALGLCLATAAAAKVSSEEAARLKKDLTPFGAERTGNADGSIPAWDGGLKPGTPDLPVVKNGDFYPNLFKDEKPLFTITAQNLAKYADKLTEGQKALFKKYAAYKINVYPTHRTFAAPQWVYDEVYKNATRVSLTPDGLGVIGGYGATPFPIPKRAEEVVFNHLLRYQSQSRQLDFTSGVVQANGRYDVGAGGSIKERYAYAVKGGSEATQSGYQVEIFMGYNDPARRKGEFVLVRDPINQSQKAREAWQYLPGQRRVRRAPTLAYDTPQEGYGGLVNFDDAYGFSGALDRFTWKLVGKKEMYIPYNNLELNLVPFAKFATGKFTNPDVQRWELHRVWVVEASLKPGQRHCFSKRVMYFDEDSWILQLADNYDSRGALWRTIVSPAMPVWSLPATMMTTNQIYDLNTDYYALVGVYVGSRFVFFDQPIPDSTYSPDQLRSEGRR
ncbi:MAG: DUF1329 domain-containing protein [Deltaproteobacteria bacterium]|nr:DUF1329 domain-containing protein [Deltaproteobacteria bacterium]